MAEIKRNPVIYSFGVEGRDACWSALTKTLNNFSNMQNKEFANANVSNDISIEMLEKSEDKNNNPSITPPPQLPLKIPPPLERRLATRRKRSASTPRRPLEVQSPGRLFNEHFTPTLPQTLNDKNVWVDCSMLFTEKDNVKTDPDNMYEELIFDGPQQKSQKLLSGINNVGLEEDSNALINCVEKEMEFKKIKPIMDLLHTHSSSSTQILTQSVNKINAIENNDQTLVSILLPQQLLEYDNGTCRNMNEDIKADFNSDSMNLNTSIFNTMSEYDLKIKEMDEKIILYSKLFLSITMLFMLFHVFF